MAKTVLVTPAQRRAAEALVEWYESKKQPVASSVRQIAASEPLPAESRPAHSVSVPLDNPQASDLLPPVSTPATAEAVKAYNTAVHNLVAAYDSAIPNWSQSIAMFLLQSEMFRTLRRAAATRRRPGRVSVDRPSPRADKPDLRPDGPEPQAGGLR